ncbi:MAG: CDP-alcohol phosphatidyltransferase family protein [Myxococcota bacterium]
MIKATFGDRLDDWIQKLFPFLFQRRLNPNALTLVGVAISTGAAVAFGLGRPVAGGCLLLAGGFFDLVDGVVARHQGDDSPFGAFLDSTMDRFVDMVVLLGLTAFFAARADVTMVCVTGTVWIMSVMTSYSKARAELVVPGFGGGLLERGERVGLLAAGAILGFLEVALVLLAVGTTWTVAQRFVHAHRALSALKGLTPVEGDGPSEEADHVG